MPRGKPQLHVHHSSTKSFNISLVLDFLCLNLFFKFLQSFQSRHKVIVLYLQETLVMVGGMFHVMVDFMSLEWTCATGNEELTEHILIGTRFLMLRQIISTTLNNFSILVDTLVRALDDLCRTLVVMAFKTSSLHENIRSSAGFAVLRTWYPPVGAYLQRCES